MKIINKTKLILVGMVIILMSIFMTGCGDNKSVVDTEKFAEVCEEFGYVVEEQDTTDHNYLTSYQIATGTTHSGVLHYIVANDDTVAKELFKTNVEAFDEEYGEDVSKDTQEDENYQKCVIKNDTDYVYVSRVDNTLFVSVVSVVDIGTINELIEEINY